MSITNIHHFNCTTFRHLTGRTFDGRKALLGSHLESVTHCLLIETDDVGLVMIDTGYSLEDAIVPHHLPGFTHWSMSLIFNPPWTVEEAAISRVKALGFSPQDVRNIIFTHLDLDHADGLEDFPWATAHASNIELKTGRTGATFFERFRYNYPVLRKHEHWETYDIDRGNLWFGLPGVQPIKNVGNDILLVPLVGHSIGHCGVAIRFGEKGWLLHAGDTYMIRDELLEPNGSAASGLLQLTTQISADKRKKALLKVSELHYQHGNEIEVFSSHDKGEFENLAGHKPKKVASA